MRALRKTSTPRLSLFPFLSVLICLIGVLMLLAVALTPTSLKPGEVELWIEGATEHGKKPIILECMNNVARSQDGKYTFTEKAEETVLASREWEGTPFTNFLNNLGRNEREEYVLFLVRPEGLSVFQTLRAILVRHNEAKCINSVSISEEPNEEAAKQLSAELKRKVRYADGKLTFNRVMSPSERDALKTLFAEESSKQAVDSLFEQSQTTIGWVDYGTELIPTEWKVRAAREVSESQKSTTDEKEAQK